MAVHHQDRVRPERARIARAVFDPNRAGGPPPPPEARRDANPSRVADKGQRLAVGVDGAGQRRDVRYRAAPGGHGASAMGSQPFQASRYWVSNGEFHAFVTAGGYREQRYGTGSV